MIRYLYFMISPWLVTGGIREGRAVDAKMTVKYSIYVEGRKEAERYKWICSEQAGCDLGEPALYRWVWDHWNGYLRARWLDHLEGKTFWLELDRGDFGLFQRHEKIQHHLALFDRILDRFKSGQENLNLINWALDWNLNTDEVRALLEILDINSRRLAHRFDT